MGLSLAGNEWVAPLVPNVSRGVPVKGIRTALPSSGLRLGMWGADLARPRPS
ncbi:hypothetical protein [Ornithinimicrobium kibberense]|uniref:hypothetical protein n=1 Tax=Ornithinimicrobium kibberense TaxID=282060 RepID=UPI00361E6053